MSDPDPRVLQGALDALASHVVVLDPNGRILFGNQAWYDFGEANGAGGTTWTAWNYLDVCIEAADSGDTDAAMVGHALQQVLDGTVVQRMMEYECSSPDEQRFFLLTMRSFLLDDRRHVVIAHENVTTRRIAERKLAESIL